MTGLTPATRAVARSTDRLALLRAFLASDSGHAYAVLDGAVVPNLPALLEESGETHAPLMQGELTADLAEVSPYLVSLGQESLVVEAVASRLWDLPWGILALADVEFQQLLRHLRGLFVVHHHEGKPMLFRFYDRRVLPVFLGASTPSERAELFGPIAALGLTTESLVRMQCLRNSKGAQKESWLEVDGRTRPNASLVEVQPPAISR